MTRRIEDVVESFLLTPPRWTLGVCAVHGSFAAPEDELDQPCPRCRVAKKPEMAAVRKHEFPPRTAADKLKLAHNRRVAQLQVDVPEGIDAALEWCDS